jgi:hypothetical protein
VREKVKKLFRVNFNSSSKFGCLGRSDLISTSNLNLISILKSIPSSTTTTTTTTSFPISLPISFIVFFSLIFFSSMVMALNSEWLLGAYEKGLEVRLVSGEILKSHQDLFLNRSLGYLSRVTTQGEGALLKRGESFVWLGPRTEVSLSSQEEGDLLSLSSGLLRIKNTVRVRFLLGECGFKDSQDIIIGWDPKSFTLKIEVLSGEISLPCFDFDKPIVLKQGEAGVFIGDQASGSVVFDLLPSGRKMPRGRISQLPQDLERIFFKNDFWFGLEQRLKKQAVPLLLKKKKEKTYLCTNPSANFGQCYIKKFKGSCIRYRCSAQGTWEYPTDLGGERLCSDKSELISCQ